MRRPVVFGISIAVTVLLLTTAVWAGPELYSGYQVVRVLVNGRPVQSDVPAILLDGRTMLPLRAVAEAAGLDVAWEPATSTAILTSKSSVPVGSKFLWVASNEDLSTALKTAGDWLPSYDGIVLQTGDSIGVYKKADVQAFMAGQISSSDLVSRATFYSAGTGTPQPTPSASVGQLASSKTLVIGQDDGRTYLGELSSSELGADSICNKIGRYGSTISSTSIWNSIGSFGSSVSTYSAFNNIASKPPMLVKDGQVVGYLTTNSLKTGAISPLGLCQRLKDAGM